MVAAIEVKPVVVPVPVVKRANYVANLPIGLFSFTEIPRKEFLYFMALK